tara:strand:+ start:3568 stop:3978 length:411 start_codon:yes stop_codon:yes gene_type:complete
MKKKFILDCVEEFDFCVLAINSHTKAYKLCWNLNKHMNMNFEKKKDLVVNESMWFANYTSYSEDSEYRLIVNRSKNGYLVPSHKSVNFFLLIKNNYWEQEKKQFKSKLSALKDVLLVYDCKLNNQMDRFIFNDTKN